MANNKGIVMEWNGMIFQIVLHQRKLGENNA